MCCYVYICGFSVDAQFNIITFPLNSEVKVLGGLIFFIGYFEL